MALEKGNIALVLLLLLASFMTSCFDNSDCAHNYADTVRFRFLTINQNNVAVPTPLDLVQVRALEVNQTLFIGAGAAMMAFSVNPFRDTTTYIFEQTARLDTVVAVFNRRPILINPECGMVQIFDIDTIWTTFDSSRVVNPGLRYVRTSQPQVNVEIFF